MLARGRKSSRNFPAKPSGEETPACDVGTAASVPVEVVTVNLTTALLDLRRMAEADRLTVAAGTSLIELMRQRGAGR
jgi:hypothetical protein